MADPRMSVIVPVRDAVATLPALLAALGAQRLPCEFEVLLVDSGSRDGSLELLVAAAAEDPRFRVLQNPGGEPAGSRNLGARAARGARLAFTDADCVPETLWLHAGLEALDRADLAQGRVLPAGPVGRFDRTVSVGHESGLYETANLFMLPEIFHRVGGFEPLPGGSAQRPFGEDTLFAWRARRLGARTAFAPDCVVRHAVHPGTAAGWVAEQRRRGRFPELVAAVPELRGHFLFARLFLSRDTAAFDAAVAGLLAAGVLRRPWPAALALPYLAGRPDPVRVAGDAAGLAALVAGSLRTHTPVL